jgi:hypothetical protein
MEIAKETQVFFGMKELVHRERYRAIGKKKETMTVMRLCEGLPREFSTYLRYIRQGHETTITIMTGLVAQSVM